MASPHPLVIPEAAGSMSRESKTRRAFLYASGLAAIMALLPFAILWASAQPWFFFHIGMPQAEAYGYSHRAYGLNCDILIAGDSTALADLEPAVIEQRTGLKTCNVAEVRPIEDFVGTHYQIDDYLAHNRPPRFLVTAWSPNDLDLEHPPYQTGYPDAFAYAMQYRFGPFMWKAMLARPGSALSFIIWAGDSLTKDALQRMSSSYPAELRADDRLRRDAARGMYHMKGPPQTACVKDFPAPPQTYARSAAGVAAFRRHYTTLQTQVMVYVTPVADCDVNIDRFRTISQGLGEKPFQLLPVSNFNQTNIHLTPEAGKLYSAQVARDILARMKSALPSASGAPAANDAPR